MSFDVGVMPVTTKMVELFEIDGKCFSGENSLGCNRHSCTVVLKNGEKRKFSIFSKVIQDFLDVVPPDAIPQGISLSHFNDVRSNWLLEEDLDQMRSFTLIHKEHSSIVKRINAFLTKKFNSEPNYADVQDLKSIQAHEKELTRLYLDSFKSDF